MRKHRSWWMGFGIGIILGASMLQLILSAQNLQKAAESPKMYTQAELDEAVEKAVREALRQNGASAGETGESDANPSDTTPSMPSAAPSAQPSDKTSEPASEPSSEAPDPQTDKVVSFYVNPGMSLKSVARSLKRLGVIEDADDFTDEARPYAKDIQPGTSVFTGNPTYEEIIAELIRRKID